MSKTMKLLHRDTFKTYFLFRKWYARTGWQNNSPLYVNKKSRNLNEIEAFFTEIWGSKRTQTSIHISNRALNSICICICAYKQSRLITQCCAVHDFTNFSRVHVPACPLFERYILSGISVIRRRHEIILNFQWFSFDSIYVYILSLSDCLYILYSALRIRSVRVFSDFCFGNDSGSIRIYVCIARWVGQFWVGSATMLRRSPPKTQTICLQIYACLYTWLWCSRSLSIKAGSLFGADDS